GGHEIMPFVLRDLIAITFPKIRKDLGRTILIKPLQLFLTREEYTAKYQSKAPVRMRLAISKAQRTAPGTAEHIPLIDAEFLSQALDIIDQVPRCILTQFRVRGRLPRTSLIKQD